MNKEWVLTQAALENLLAWLSPDRDEAGARYEAIRARLIKLFTCHGCAEAEDLADETINRVISKLGTLAEGYEGEPALYFYGVAKKVRQEYQKHKFRPAPPPALPHEDVEEEYACLEECMQTLPPDQRRVVVEYYQGEKRAKINNRKRLAHELGIALNALRIRAHRLRAALLRCVEECLARAN